MPAPPLPHPLTLTRSDGGADIERRKDSIRAEQLRDALGVELAEQASHDLPLRLCLASGLTALVADDD